MNPEPMAKVVCTACGEDWGEHVELADDMSCGENLVVTLEQCLILLKRRNQGPPGPQGSTGPAGWMPSTLTTKQAV